MHHVSASVPPAAPSRPTLAAPRAGDTPAAGDRCTPSQAAAAGGARRSADSQISGWAVDTGGSGPPPDLRTYAQQSSDSNHEAARLATLMAPVSLLPGPFAKAGLAVIGALSGAAWDASQQQADAAAACPANK